MGRTACYRCTMPHCAEMLLLCQASTLLWTACQRARPLPDVGDAEPPSSSASATARNGPPTRGSSPLLAPVSLGPPRLAKPSAARLSAALQAQLNDVEVAPMASVQDLIAAALRETSRRLHFGMQHATQLGFGIEERAAHCVEYSQSKRRTPRACDGSNES